MYLATVLAVSISLNVICYMSLKTLVSTNNGIRKEIKGLQDKIIDQDVQLKRIESKQLTQTEVKGAVVGELRPEVAKLAFTPIKLNLK